MTSFANSTSNRKPSSKKLEQPEAKVKLKDKKATSLALTQAV